MTSIFDVLATLPSGRPGPTLTYDELGQYLATHCNTDEDRDRTTRHALRHDLYLDGGNRKMESLIHDQFTDPTVRDLRKKWIPYAKFNNALRRITHELATVYTEPARRIVEDATDNAVYHVVLEMVRMDERALEISRLLNLHRALVVGFRVRLLPDGTREPVIDVASPANARVVLHPNDDTLIVGWLIRTSHRSARQVDVPAWTLWTDTECVSLRDDFSVIGDSYALHGLGVCPWVPVTLGPPASGFWPGNEGEDLVAAHLAIWFSNILLLKESKSANVQAVINGDGANGARGQAADSEVPANLVEGQSVTTIDTSMDLEMFQGTANHVLDAAGLNHGLPPAVLSHQGTQSAEARELLRIPLKELRRQQQIPLRRFERALAIVMAAVLAVDLPLLAFDASTFRIEFASSDTPLDPAAQHALFLEQRAAGLTNTVDYLVSLRPGLTPEQALEAIHANYRIEVERNRAMRPLQAVSGSLGASSPAQETSELRRIAREVLDAHE